MHRAVLPFVILSLLTLVSCTSAFAGKRVALVIGNSAYRTIARLDNPVNDAGLMAESLKAIGFELVGNGAQLDLDKSGLDSAIQIFGDQLRGAEVALFYFAGHGVQLRGSNFLVPVNANPAREADVDFQMVDVAVVLRQMEGSGTRLNVVMLDACRNNPFGGRGLRASGGGLAQMQAPEGTLISYATQPGNVAQDGLDGHSPYTEALADNISKPGRDIFQTFNQVGLAVKRATGGAQQPWLSSSPIDGTFYFVALQSPDTTVSNATNTIKEQYSGFYSGSVRDSGGKAAKVQLKLARNGKTVFGSYLRDSIYGNVDGELRDNRFVFHWEWSGSSGYGVATQSGNTLTGSSGSGVAIDGAGTFALTRQEPVSDKEQGTERKQIAVVEPEKSPHSNAISAYVMPMSGAPGVLARAMKAELSARGIHLTNGPGRNAYKVAGVVGLSESSWRRSHSANIDWVVFDPRGKRLGSVSQQKDVSYGTLDGWWDTLTADAAKGAADGVIKLFLKEAVVTPTPP